MNTSRQSAPSNRNSARLFSGQGTSSRLTFVLLALLSLFIASGCATASPHALYRSVWKATPEHIYDPAVLKDWNDWEHRYDGRLQTEEDAEKAIKQMLSATGDRYTYFMNGKAVSADQARREGTFTGVGVVLDIKVDKSSQVVRAPDGNLLPRTDRGGFPVVTKLIKGSPAQKAGLKTGDAITSINGQDTRGHTLDQLVERLRGDAGTRVSLGVRRQGQDWTLTLTRATVNVPAVTVKILTDSIGYLRLEGFEQADAIKEFRNGLEQLKDSQALVIDVRGNRGGLVYNAVAIASFFMRDGKVVTIRHRIPGGGYQTEVIKLTARNGLVREVSSSESSEVDVTSTDREPYLSRQRPVVILVDGHSASATELFVGALKDNRDATIVGTRTFGKGIGQNNIAMPNGTQLHVTSLRYFTPNGTWIGDGGNTQPTPHGIEPHILVAPNADLEFGEHNDNQLEKAIELINKRLGIPTPRPVFRTAASCAA